MFFDASTAIFVTKNHGKPLIRFAIVNCAALALLCVSSPAIAADTWKLEEDLQGKTRQINTDLKVQGTMRINPDGRKVRHYPMALTGQYVAIERNLSPTTAIRYYKKAETESTANEKPLKDSLPTVKRLISVHTDTTGPLLSSPEYTLSREELELISVPGNPAALGQLLPQKAVKKDQAWSPDNKAIAQCLGIDAVNSHEITGVLTEVDNSGVAKITFAGKASGAIQGVATEIELKARMNVDTRQKLITWFAASIEEDRAIGHAVPGFKVTAVVRTQIQATQPIEQLSDSSLAKIDLDANRGPQMLSFAGKQAGFRVLHDREWFAMAETAKQTVFRMVSDGELLAQANINRLTNLKPGEQTTLEGFEVEVKKALGERLGQVIDAAQSVNSQGLRELRVSAVGTADGMPITWIYYLISDDQGHRYSTVFTFETKLAEQFGQADRSFMSGFDLINEAQQPTEAGETEEAAPEKPALIQARIEPATTIR
ncbi:hypothetical protein DTL42_23945 [Bremerella cremea]|uniref:Uncharacterized protein n=1 Tax=Bremerella cremea TaxID=1031537 RepID=A0A368KIR0_9BACT|nr:hypothetical protein [Bremerella cremea]RCS40432.1 hypothetical protein DTL42_23945 [Bremerella cremea]